MPTPEDITLDGGLLADIPMRDRRNGSYLMTYEEREALKYCGWQMAACEGLPMQRREKGLLYVAEAHFQRSLQSFIRNNGAAKPHASWNQYLRCWLNAVGKTAGPCPVFASLQSKFAQPKISGLAPGMTYWGSSLLRTCDRRELVGLDFGTLLGQSDSPRIPFELRLAVRRESWDTLALNSSLPMETRRIGLLLAARLDFELSLESWNRASVGRSHCPWREYIASWMEMNSGPNGCLLAKEVFDVLLPFHPAPRPA